MCKDFNLNERKIYKLNTFHRTCKLVGYMFAIAGVITLLLSITSGKLSSIIVGIALTCLGGGALVFFYLDAPANKERAEKEEHSSKLILEMTKFDDRFSHTVTKVFSYIFLTICAVLAFLPFYWMVKSSVESEIEYRQSVPTFFPKEFMFKNYSMVLRKSETSNYGFWQMIINTLTVGISSTVLGVIVCIITAYALARMNFKGKGLLFTLMLGTMMIPGEMFTLTNYITTVVDFRWQDSFTIMIVPFLVSIYYIYLLRNNFMQIPNTLYQAAKVDGLSDIGYLIKVMIPLTAPTLISVTLLKFIGTWNSYIWPRLVNSQSWQLVTNWVTGSFCDRGGELYGGFYGTSMPLTTLKMAAVCMVSLPLFVLFICFRKYIMKGVSKSGTKG